MNIDLTALFIIIAISMLVVGSMSFLLAGKKSTSRKMATLLGTIFAIVPIVGIIYLIILWQKPDLSENTKG